VTAFCWVSYKVFR